MDRINPDQLANLYPDDGDSHVNAIRELAEAVADLQGQMAQFELRIVGVESEIEELRSALDSGDDEASTD